MEILKRYFLFFRSIVVFCLVQISYSTPPDFCFDKFNGSDCNVAPKEVFSYYKPGSRCEREVWRGCPTLNKFNSEADCSHLCIFHFGNEKDSSIPMGYNKTVNAVCLNPVNVKYCNDNLTKVFIFNKFLNTCVSIIWGGCPYLDNVFKNKLDCLETCFRLDWSEKVKEMPEIHTNEVNSVLDNFTNDMFVTKKKLLDLITTSTHKYSPSIKTTEQTDSSTMWRNETENMITDIGTTRKEESQNEEAERKKITTIEPTKMFTSASISSITEKLTESIPITKESTTESTESIIKTTKSTIETTESTTKLSHSTTETSTTLIVEPTKTTMPETTTMSGITTTKPRGTAKRVVLPQDVDSYA